jgi:hypothetical protein
MPADERLPSQNSQRRSRISAYPVPLEYSVTCSELRLCGVAVFTDHARHDGSSPYGPQACEIGWVPGR